MASRKEEKEKRRSERLAAERRETSGQRTRLILGYAVAGVLGVAVLAGVVIVIASAGGDDGGSTEAGDVCEEAAIEATVGVARGVDPDCREGTPPPEIQQGDLQASASAAGCELEEDLPEEGNQHFTDEDRDPGWETSPPTSGDHYGTNTEVGSGALADGAYAEPPSMARAVHSLEHGRVAIQYSPDLPEEAQLELKGLFEEDPNGMLLFPNPDMPYEVAVTSWTNLIGCDSYEGTATIDAIRNFRDTKRGDGREDVPIHVASQ